MNESPVFQSTSPLKVREANPKCDLPAIFAVFEAARKIMADSGNPHQWRKGYPSEERILADIDLAGGYVIEAGEKIVAYFAFLPSPEPTYSIIYEGQWLDDTQPYHVIHRIASYPFVHGIFGKVIEFCLTHDRNLRIDTHKDNRIMQHNILKHGFSYCGIIHLANGDERLAYQMPLRDMDGIHPKSIT